MLASNNEVEMPRLQEELSSDMAAGTKAKTDWETIFIVGILPLYVSNKIRNADIWTNPRVPDLVDRA